MKLFRPFRRERAKVVALEHIRWENTLDRDCICQKSLFIIQLSVYFIMNTRITDGVFDDHRDHC